MRRTSETVKADSKPESTPASSTLKSPTLMKKLHLPVSKIFLRNSSDYQAFKSLDLKGSKESLKESKAKDLNTSRSSGFESAKKAIKKTLLHKPKDTKQTLPAKLPQAKPLLNKSAT